MKRIFPLKSQRPFLKNFLRTCRVLFWETCSENFSEFHFFTQRPETSVQSVFFFQNVCFSSKNSFRQLGRSSFDNPLKKRNLLPKDRSYLFGSPQNFSKLIVFLKTSPGNVSLVQQNVALTNLPQFLRPDGR